MGVIYTGNFYRPEEPPARRGSRPAPAEQAMPRWLPLLLLWAALLVVVLCGHAILRAVDALLISGTVPR